VSAHGGFAPGGGRERPAFLGADGRAVVVALDHALAGGQVPVLDRPRPILERVCAARPDGLILTAGMASLRPPGAAPWLLTADYYATSLTPGASGDVELHVPLWSPDHALRLGASGLKCLLVYGRRDPAVQRANVRFVAELLEAAHGVGLPVMVEAVLWGADLAPEREHDGALVAHAARTAFELGADVIKVALPDDLGPLARLAQSIPVPLLLMGGPARDPAELFPRLRAALDAGIRGVALGRNVWGDAQPGRMVAALHDLVHGDASVADALDRWRGAS